MNHQTIAVLDYGSQYSQLFCRRVREKQVYAELIPWDRADEVLPKLQPAGIILSGGPNSVYDSGAPTLPAIVLNSNVPVLGICYGLQLLAHTMGGRVAVEVLRLAPALLAAGHGVAAQHALPRYIRDKVAKTTEERASEKAAALGTPIPPAPPPCA